MVQALSREEDPVKKVRKLSLNKETVRHLTKEELKGVAGGNPTNHNTCPNTCANTCPSTCPSTCSGTGCNESVVVCITQGPNTCGSPETC
jgi:hypothetical protein